MKHLHTISQPPALASGGLPLEQITNAKVEAVNQKAQKVS